MPRKERRGLASIQNSVDATIQRLENNIKKSTVEDWLCYILICIYTCIYMQHHNGTINKQTQEDFFIKICTSHFIVRVRKGLLRGFMVRGSWRPNRTAIFWPTLLWPSVLCLSRSPGLLNRRPRSPLGWLSLLHLISNFSGPQLNRGPREPLRPGVAFPNTHSSLLQLQLQLQL